MGNLVQHALGGFECLGPPKVSIAHSALCIVTGGLLQVNIVWYNYYYMENMEKNNTKINELRNELTHLRKEREKVILEKGLIAQDNKDLRENAAYAWYEQREHSLTSRIHGIIEEIYALTELKK